MRYILAQGDVSFPETGSKSEKVICFRSTTAKAINWVEVSNCGMLKTKPEPPESRVPKSPTRLSPRWSAHGKSSEIGSGLNVAREGQAYCRIDNTKLQV